MATLGTAQHDAQAALLAGKVYVFGGGSFSELDHIFSFDPASHALATVGSLPVAQSDVAVTSIGNTAYVVGGYDGVSWRNTILAYSPGETRSQDRRHAAGGAALRGGRGDRRPRPDRRRLDSHRRQPRDLQLRPEHRPGRRGSARCHSP